MIHPNKKYKMELKVEDLDRYYVKRRKARVLRFKTDKKILNNEDLRNMAKALKLTKKTQKLEIIPQGNSCHVAERGISYLSEAIRKVSSLRSIFINFGWCGYEDVFDESSAALWILNQGLRNLKNLQNLNLSFEWRFEVTEKELQRFGKVLRSLISLQKLHLTFDVCNYIDGEKLAKLGQVLEKLVGLQKLGIMFNGCSDLTDEGLKMFSEYLKKLTFLRSIMLYFRFCSEVTNIGKDYVWNTLKSLEALGGLKEKQMRCE